MFNKIFKVGKRSIGENQPCFIIGEIGSNHNRDKKTVKLLIDACADAKFDAVKFQIYDPEEAFSKNVTTKDVHLQHLYGLKPWWKIARDKILMPREWFKEMYVYAKKKKLIVFSTVHRIQDYYFLKNIGVPLIKIASIDLQYNFLLEKISRLNKPVIISTGMATFAEIKKTLEIFKKNNLKKFGLLHCVSQYPPPDNEININNMKMFNKKFNCVVGYSDHSNDNLSSIVAVANGAKIIEKHITLDKKYPGPDHHFAIEPDEMKDLALSIRRVEKILGSYSRILSKNDKDAKKMIRRSIVLKSDIKKGMKLSLDLVKFARPGTGISTNLFNKVKNKRVKYNLKAETVLKKAHFE